MKRAAVLMMLAISTGALAQTNVLSTEQRMKRSIIPVIEFRQADAVDVLNFLIDASTPKPPTNVPCLALLQTNASATIQKRYILRLEDGAPLELPPLSLVYHRISFLDAIRKITERLGLIFRFENDQLVFFTKEGKRIIRKECAEPSLRFSSQPQSKSNEQLP